MRHARSIDVCPARLLPFPPPPAAELKLWSVLVTIFGDLLGQDEAEIGGRALRALTTAMGFQPQALRVALHRLRRDGWIASRRAGRTARYRMTARAAAETAAVRARVYGTSRAWRAAMAMGPPWAMVLGRAPAGPALAVGRGVHVVPLASLRPCSDTRPEGVEAWARVEEVHVAASLRAQILLACRAEGHAALAEGARQVLEASDWLKSATPRVRLLQRLVVLHQWRRLVLLSNPVAEVLAGTGAPPEEARRRVRAVLARLPAPEPELLETVLCEA